MAETTEMSFKEFVNFFDKFMLFFLVLIGGFVLIYTMVAIILPEHNNWKMYLASIILAFNISYFTIRLILLIIWGDEKGETPAEANHKISWEKYKE